MTIIISKDGKNARKFTKSDFEQEKELQKYLETNPDIVPIYEIDEDKELLILAREFRTDHGPIDALGTDKDGEIYIIETKLFTNPDRRNVVAQVLDYGASLEKNMDSNEFLLQLGNATYEKYKQNLNERLQSKFKTDDEETQKTVDNIKKNFTAGRFKFVVLLDKIDSRLKDLVYFISKNSSFNIYPVEFEYYEFDDYQIIIPKLYGAEIKKSTEIKPSGIRKQLDETSFFEEAANNLNAKEVQAIQKLYDFSEKVARVGWGSSFSVYFDKISPSRSLYYVYPDGRFVFNSHMLQETPGSQRYSDEFKEKLSRIKGITIPDSYPESSPRFSIDMWSPVVDDFINAVNDLITV